MSNFSNKAVKHTPKGDNPSAFETQESIYSSNSNMRHTRVASRNGKHHKTVVKKAIKTSKSHRTLSKGLMEYNNILRTVRGLYPHSFREAQRLASEIRKSGVDPESEVAIMKAVSQISRRKDVAKMGEVDRMSGEMVGNGHTETLPIVPWTLRQARHSEVKRVGVKFSVINTSFQRLFGDTISSLTPKTSVSITVNVRIVDSSLDGKEVTL